MNQPRALVTGGSLSGLFTANLLRANAGLRWKLSQFSDHRVSDVIKRRERYTFTVGLIPANDGGRKSYCFRHHANGGRHRAGRCYGSPVLPSRASPWPTQTGLPARTIA